MNYYFYYLSVLLKLVITQADQWFVFTEDKFALSNCIENYFLKGNDPYFKELESTKVIADFVANRFYGRTKTNKQLKKITSDIFHYMKSKKSNLFRNHQIHKPLLNSMREALIHCFYSLHDHIVAIPIFIGEPHEIGVVLNYILVDWPKPLYHMIRTRKSRTVLRRYAEDATTKLAYALHSVNNHEHFRYLLRFYWTLRAQYLFNGNVGKLSYLRHRYTMEHPFPHTYDSQAELSNQNACPFSDRNPQVTQDDFDRIMGIHTANRPGYGEYDAFLAYEQNGNMSSAEYYIETHIDQFYRLIFFFLELQIYGISSGEEDIYDDNLPYDLVPIHIQRIVYNDLAYRYYLLSLRVQLESTMINDSLYQIDIGHSLSSARVHEEDLISLLSIWIQHNCFISTTTTRPVSSTNSNPMKRKGSVWFNRNGKHFCNPPQATSFDETQRQQVGNGNSSRDSSIDDVNQTGFLEESVFFINSLKNFHFATSSRYEGM